MIASIAMRRYVTSAADFNSPGWVHTGLTGAGSGIAKPHGAWTPEQTVEYMMEKVFDEGDFYVLCPDNETTVVSRYQCDEYKSGWKY